MKVVLDQSFSRLHYLNLTACRLTEQSKDPLVEFLHKIEPNRKLTLDLRLQTQSMKKAG